MILCTLCIRRRHDHRSRGAWNQDQQPAKLGKTNRLGSKLRIIAGGYGHGEHKPEHGTIQSIIDEMSRKSVEIPLSRINDENSPSIPIPRHCREGG